MDVQVVREGVVKFLESRRGGVIFNAAACLLNAALFIWLGHYWWSAAASAFHGLLLLEAILGCEW